MHVSSKIAFNLGDEFFEALENTEAVALETNPETWLDYYRDSGLVEASTSVYNRYKDYTESSIYKQLTGSQEYELKSIQSLFMSQERMLNQLLYRYNFRQENYEETTYLDMFIFQSAKKSKKPIYSLEDFLESYFLAERSKIPDEEEDNSKNYFGSRSYQNDIETAYLERNLDLLDNMITENFSKNYRKYLLNIRNENMVNAMDSLMPKLSIFAGVGAAHLPGEEGMIEMLREKGYTVEPVTFEKKSKVNKAFKKIKNSAIDSPISAYTFGDGRITVTAPGKFYDENSYSKSIKNSFFLPDYANGAYYGIERMPIRHFEKDARYINSINYIDSVLYLVTPGDIIDHETKSVSGFDAIEVVTKLPRGNYIHITCVETPEELIVFKAEGNKAFIKSKNVKSFFKEIKIKENSSKEKFNKTGIKSIELDRLAAQEDEEKDIEVIGTAHGFDYTLKKVYLNDFNYLEEDKFEISYLVKEFAEERSLEVLQKEASPGNKNIVAELISENQKDTFSIAFSIYHNHYFRQTIDANFDQAKKYLNRLKFDASPNIPVEMKEVTDTAMGFKVKTYKTEEVNPELMKEFISLRDDYLKADQKKDSLDKEYKGDNNSITYSHPSTGETILVDYQRVNNYFSLEKGFQDLRDQVLLKNNEDSVYYTTTITNEIQKEDYFQLDYHYSKYGTDRILVNKSFLIEDRYITITASYDTTLGASGFINTFFNSFQPYPKNEQKFAITDAKCEKWLNDVRSETYQLYEQAKNSIHNVVFDSLCQEDLKKLMFNDTLETIEDIRATILDKYDYFFSDDQEQLKILSEFYKQNKLSPELQIPALQAVSNQQTQASTKLLMDFLEDNPPIIRKEYDLYRIFGAFNDSTHLLLPVLDRLQEFGIEYEEYLPRIIYLIDRGIFNEDFTTDVITPEFEEKILKKAKKDIRKMAYAKSETSSEYKEVRDELIEVMSILFSFDDPYERFGTVMELSDTISNKKYRSHLLSKRINRGNAFTPEDVKNVIDDSSYVYTFFFNLSDEKIIDSLYKAYNVSEALLYESFLRTKGDYSDKEDSLYFMNELFVSTYRDSGKVYMYKSTSKYGSPKLKAIYFINNKKTPQIHDLNTMSVTIEDDDLEKAQEKLIQKISYSNRPRIDKGYNYY